MSDAHLLSSLEGPAGAPVVILANPIGTTRAIWDAQAGELREDYRLLRFELRGHGAPGARRMGTQNRSTSSTSRWGTRTT